MWRSKIQPLSRHPRKRPRLRRRTKIIIKKRGSPALSGNVAQCSRDNAIMRESSTNSTVKVAKEMPLVVDLTMIEEETTDVPKAQLVN